MSSDNPDKAFCSSAEFYDLIYTQRDYTGEAQWVIELVESHKSLIQPVSVLELGCGTGRLAELMARHGWKVHGVDRCAEMLKFAQERANNSEPTTRAQLSFAQGDIRDLQVSSQYSLVLALYHVLGYVTDTDELATLFKRVAKTLRPGGLWLCDFWYGPAVLKIKPEERTTQYHRSPWHVVRHVSPQLRTDISCVDITYKLHARRRDNDQEKKISELHQIRYFLQDEIENWAKLAGLELLKFGASQSDAPATDDTWSAYALCLRP